MLYLPELSCAQAQWEEAQPEVFIFADVKHLTHRVSEKRHNPKSFFFPMNPIKTSRFFYILNQSLSLYKILLYFPLFSALLIDSPFTVEPPGFIYLILFLELSYYLTLE